MLRRYLAIAGFLIGGAGVVIERRALVWTAISLLGVSLLLRLGAGLRERRTASPPDSLSPPPDE